RWQFKYVSLGSIVIALTMPFIEMLMYGFTPTFYYLLVCLFLILILHRKNIIRLREGKELGA
ncbi:MAG: glycerol-3-phosphate acyltransferase, partial [Bacteroidaceae bacterium]|nr:glycerol-3-phosphate acyltransferase [Bacteroidaceae bacterium]